MGFIALLILLPLIAYCLVQTIRDYRARRVLMSLWGMAMTALLFWLFVRAGRGPQY
jgi:hypothetical protein